jgi:hypothetical protein
LYTFSIASINHSGGTNESSGPLMDPPMTSEMSVGKYLLSILSSVVSFSTVRRQFLVSEAFSVPDFVGLPRNSVMSSSDSSSDLSPPLSDKRGRSLNFRPSSRVPIASLTFGHLLACVLQGAGFSVSRSPSLVLLGLRRPPALRIGDMSIWSHSGCGRLDGVCTFPGLSRPTWPTSGFDLHAARRRMLSGR